jgi:hypothetical protein
MKTNMGGFSAEKGFFTKADGVPGGGGGGGKKDDENEKKNMPDHPDQEEQKAEEETPKIKNGEIDDKVTINKEQEQQVNPIELVRNNLDEIDEILGDNKGKKPFLSVYDLIEDSAKTIKDNINTATGRELSAFKYLGLELKKKAHLLDYEIEATTNGQDRNNSDSQPDTAERVKDVNEMNLEELTDYLASVIYPSDDTNNARNRFANLIGQETDVHKKSFLMSRVLNQGLIVEGDAGQKDFSVWFNSIYEQYTKLGYSYQDMIRALFLKYEDGNKIEDVEKLDELEINMRAVELWEYAVARIKDKYGGITKEDEERLYREKVESEGGEYEETFNDNFSYNNLVGDMVDKFKKHLKKRFGDIPPQILEELIKFTQAHDAKTVAYIPWLAHETTRSHGNAISRQKKQPLQDALFTCAPLAAGIYSRGRYDRITPNNTSPDLIYFNPELYESFILPTALNYQEKKEAAERLHYITNRYHQLVLWNGNFPQWVKDMRRKIDVRDSLNPERFSEECKEVRDDLSINNSWFPLPGELVVDIVKVENEKREKNKKWESGSLSREEIDREKKAFIDKYVAMGYAKYKITENNTLDIDGTIKAIGFASLKMANPGNYQTAFEAYTMMNEFFYQPQGKLSFDEAKDKFRYWTNKCVGKSKLVPGRHHLTFTPQTLRAMDKIVNHFAERNNYLQVKRLLKEFRAILSGADGLPREVQIEVEAHLQKESAYFGMYPSFAYSEYINDLYDFKNADQDDWEIQLRKMLPLHYGKRDANQKKLTARCPWDWKKVAEKDTSK